MHVSMRGLFCLFMILLATWASPASAYNVKQCDEIAENEIRVAADYITKRLQKIADQFTHISKDDRDEFVKKWPRITIVCRDEGQQGKSAQCLARSELDGLAHGGVGSRINICFYNLVDRSDTLCALVKAIVHESGHAHGFPTLENHNDPTPDVFANDPVYVMGFKAQAFCQADTKYISDVPLIGRSSLAFGEACRSDDQCLSGRCLGGSCQCDQDGDCPTGERCFKPAVGANFCSVTDRAIGASCTRDEQCLSSHCEGGQCVCRRDGDCPAGQICRTPFTGQNRCEAGADGNFGLGVACQRDNQCKSAQCEGGQCVCRSDADCPTGQSCFTPVAAQNFCQSTTLGLKAACNRDSQCRSDKCQSGECVCKKDSDCGSGMKCKTPLVGKNSCAKS